MFRKIMILILIVTVCMAGAVNAYAADNSPIRIDIDGQAVEMPAMIWEGELFLPLRAVSEELGFTVQWYGDKKEIQMSSEVKQIKMTLTDYRIDVNGHEVFMTAGYRFLDDRTYLSQDFFSDNLGLNVVWDKAGNKVSLERSQENSVIIAVRKEYEETEALKLSIQYPELKGLENSEVQDKLNSLFAKLASEAKDRDLELAKYIGKDEISRHIKAEGYFNYKVKYNQKGLISIVFYDYQYSGGAHGGTVQSSYTFDLNTGTEYELKDLFPEGSDYVSMISSEVKRQLEEEKMAVLLAPFDSIRADHDFYLSGSSIVVYFQQYEILPYAYGIPEFSVDRPQIKQ